MNYCLVMEELFDVIDTCPHCKCALPDSEGRHIFYVSIELSERLDRTKPPKTLGITVSDTVHSKDKFG